MYTTLRSDKHKNPVKYHVQFLSFQEIQSLSSRSHVDCLDKNSQLAQVKITSIKSWKRQPGHLEFHFQYGLYEHFTEDFYSDRSQKFLVKIVDDSLDTESMEVK
jgi:hypothetical protein